MPNIPPITADLIISDRLSDANQRRVPVSNLQVSWELSNIGVLTCEVEIDDLDRAGIDYTTLMSKWVRYRHPTAGAWGGMVTTLDADDGTLALGCESWAAALRGATTTANIAAGSRMIATLMQQIDLNSAYTGIKRGTGDTRISSTMASDVLPDFDFFAEGQDLFEQFLPAVMELWYKEFEWRQGLQAAGWNVDPTTREFNFDSTYGEDLSSRVALRDHRHNVSSGWTDDVTDIVNRVLVPGTVKLADAWVNQMIIGTEPGSIAKHGQKSELRSVDDAPANANLQSWVRDRAAVLSRNEQSVTLDIVDEEQIFAHVREGNILRCDMANSRAGGRFVVRVRALTVNTGVMTVSGEAELY